MTKYRLKSKLYSSEWDKEEKDKGILGTGISGGQALMLGAAALTGRKMYRNNLVRTGRADANLMAQYKNGSQRQRNMVAKGLKRQRSANAFEANQRISAAQSQIGTDIKINDLTHAAKMKQATNAQQAHNLAGSTKKDTRAGIMEAYNGYNPVI